MLLASAAVSVVAVAAILGVSLTSSMRHGTAQNLGTELYERRDFPAAEKFFVKALALAEAADAPVERLSALRWLAMACEAQGKRDVAVRYLEQVVQHLEMERGPDDHELGVAYSDLARLHVKHRDFEEAKRLHGLALALYQRTLGTEHPRVAGVLCNLGVVAHVEGDLPRAELLYRQAVEILERVPKARYPDLAICYSNQCSLYTAQGKYDDAEACITQAISIAENEPDALAGDRVRYLEEYESLLHATGREDKAQELRSRVAALKAGTDPDH